MSRKKPWINEQELQDVVTCMFGPDATQEHHIFALSRMEAWLARGTWSANIENTFYLLQATLCEGTHSNLPGTMKRSIYNSAIIRFVNGVVDPLQTHFYARAISVIASQLSLPLSLVELRHAGTHESLPSLQVLRQATAEALEWLHLRFWIPLLQRADDSQLEKRQADLDQFSQELHEQIRIYKVDRKDGLRDVTKHRAKDIVKSCKTMDKIIRSYSLLLDAGDQDCDYGLALLISALLQPGSLVPVSKKKRATAQHPTLSQEIFDIWHPLLHYFVTEHPTTFLSQLLERIIETLAITPVEDGSYNDSLLVWLNHLYATLARTDEDVQDVVLKTAMLRPSPYTVQFLEFVSRLDGPKTTLEVRLDQLLPMAKSRVDLFQSKTPNLFPTASELARTAEERLAALEQRFNEHKEAEANKAAAQAQQEEQEQKGAKQNDKMATDSDGNHCWANVNLFTTGPIVPIGSIAGQDVSQWLL